MTVSVSSGGDKEKMLEEEGLVEGRPKREPRLLARLAGPEWTGVGVYYMYSVLGNVAENKNIRHLRSNHPRSSMKMHTRFRSCLTNRCSESRVGDDRSCRSS